MTAKTNVPTGLGVAYYRGADGRAIFTNPPASQLPMNRQASLLREAARAMTREAERLTRGRQQ